MLICSLPEKFFSLFLSISTFVAGVFGNQFDKAESAFEKAKEDGFANAITYNSFITAAGNCGQFDEAESAFESRKAFYKQSDKSGFYTTISYSLIMLGRDCQSLQKPKPHIAFHFLSIYKKIISDQTSNGSEKKRHSDNFEKV